VTSHPPQIKSGYHTLIVISQLVIFHHAFGSGLNLWFIVFSTDAFRTSFIQHRFHDAGQAKDGAGTHPISFFNQ